MKEIINKKEMKLFKTFNNWFEEELRVFVSLTKEQGQWTVNIAKNARPLMRNAIRVPTVAHRVSSQVKHANFWHRWHVIIVPWQRRVLCGLQYKNTSICECITAFITVCQSLLPHAFQPQVTIIMVTCIIFTLVQQSRIKHIFNSVCQ
jgi:hypothetical protein